MKGATRYMEIILMISKEKKSCSGQIGDFGQAVLAI